MGLHLKLSNNKKYPWLKIILPIFVIFIVIIAIIMGGSKNNNSTLKTKVLDTPFTTSTEKNKVSNENVNVLDEKSSETNPNLDISVDDLSGKDDEVDQIHIDDHDEFELPEKALNALNNLLDATNQAIKIKEQFSYTVEPGDTFANILEQSGLDSGLSHKLTKEFPEFTHLKPGQQFYWILDDQGNLAYLNWLISRKEERVYERNKDDTFTRQILEKESQWKKEILQGTIDSSFAQSLHNLGLSARQINQVTSALQWQINMRHLRKGDRFSISLAREYIDGKPTGQGNIDGIHMLSNNHNYYAIQADNGRYYDEEGQTLGKGFNRYPLLKQARVSSPFNLHRRHPITHKIRPHKGVDFAVRSGTPVIAPADGTVVKVAYQARGAGRYIVLRHNRKYQTIYMHLSRSLVKAGQKIKRGQRIALSGNTGRSTGPHLHYEFRINNRPVNPLTVKLPSAENLMSTAERKHFFAKVKVMKEKLSLS